MDPLSTVAAFAADTPSAALPDEVLERTALILADCIGAIVGGAAEPDVAALTARPGVADGGTALVIGTTRTASPGHAALLNGTAGTTLEMDEGHQFAKGHPGIHVVPAALATASTREVSGRDFLAAIAIGYDVAARVGLASALRPAMHPHGTWGAIGAAVAVQRILGADAAAMREAMNMAASLGLTTSRRTMLEGGTVRNAFAGVSGQMGILVADLLAAGFTGDRDGVGQVFGRVASDRFDPAAMVEELSTRWEVTRNYFKMHSCCRYNHAALDALADIRARTPELDVKSIRRIDVATYALGVELDEPAPANVLAAKFSLPFALATTLVNGSSGVESFTLANVGDPAIRALAARVALVEDPQMTARLPDRRPALVAVSLSDGRTLSAFTETNRGDWTDPYAPAEIRDKFVSLATRLWPERAAIAVWNATLALTEAADAGGLLQLMADAPRPQSRMAIA
ncbi:MmgE/PrpD family protein [Acuticoccus sp.]|uniref:MmgE/PrpD family protein n=1 Tax=Acuticoccus sp. TaxID=1904378 RepID=UPI003B5303BE